MAYNNQQIYDAMNTSYGQGYSIDDIIKGAQSNYGVDEATLRAAYAQHGPGAGASQPGSQIGPNGETQHLTRWGYGDNDQIKSWLDGAQNGGATSMPGYVLPGSPDLRPGGAQSAAQPVPQAGQTPSQAFNENRSFSSSYAQPTMQAYQKNPYLDQVAAGMTTQSNNNLQRNILPGIRSGSVQAGQYGGSRQGIAEGLAIGDSQTGLNSALASMYGNDYSQQMSRNLSQYQADQGYNLGRMGADNQRFSTEGNLALGNKQADYGYDLGLGSQALTNQGQQLNFYDSQRTGDRADAALGASLYGLGTQGPWQPIQNANSTYAPYTGYGNTTTSTGSGGDWQSVLGGALTGATLGKQMNWWG